MSYKLNYMRVGDFGFITEKDEYEPGEKVRVIYNAIASDESYIFSADADDTKTVYEGGVAIITFTMPEHDVELKCSSRSTWDPSPAPGFNDPVNAFQFMRMINPVEQKQSELQASEPVEVKEWTCPACKAVNTGKFCSECGTPRT